MSRGTLDPAASYCFRVRDFHPLWSDFPDNSTNKSVHFCSPQPRYARITVWALPVPLAATPGMTVVFFSSGYLDVSVRRVPSLTLLKHSCFCSCKCTRSLSVWVPPFRYPRLIRYLPLPAAFRSLSRLSSAPSAKASTLCSF